MTHDQAGGTHSSTPTPGGAGQSRLVRACRREPVDYTPVWFMHQAGRHLPQYREVEARHSMMEMVATPELAATLTMQPLPVLDVDAAIIFTDILLPLIGMGLPLDYHADRGPVLEKRLERPYDIDLLAVPLSEETILANTLKAVRIVADELASPGLPLIGFAGAPFTLASYAIEGGGRRSFARVKALMYHEPAAWQRLMQKLVTVQVDYLLRQVEAGASVLQVVDSNAGMALGQQDYLRYVHPYHRELFLRLQNAAVPVIHYSAGTAPYIGDVAGCGGDVIAVDWRMPLDWYWRQIGESYPLQGNLDPAYLLAPWRELRPCLDGILARGGARLGHIFNLGAGVLPQTPVEHAQRLVAYVHETSARREEL